MRSRGSWQPVEPGQQIDRDMPCIEKPGDSRNDCRLLYLRVCEGKGYLESTADWPVTCRSSMLLSLSEFNSIDVAE